MKLVLAIVSLVMALTGYYTQAQLASNGPKTFIYIDEVPELLGQSESQNSAFANEESDSGSFTEAQQVLAEPDNYSYIDEDQRIIDGNLVLAVEPNNPAYTEVDDMAMLLRISYWCRKRDGRCRRRHIPCEDTEDIETPYGGYFCKKDSRRCCYPSPCRKKWCKKANEECVAKNWAIVGSCQCKDGYIRDKHNYCIDDSSYGNQCRDYCRYQCHGDEFSVGGKCPRGGRCCKRDPCSKIWCDKANEECVSNNWAITGSCQCKDGYIRDKQNNCVATCIAIWCESANEECEDNSGTTAGSCQCADGYVRDKQNNCVVTTTTSVPTMTTTSTTKAQSTTAISECGGKYTSSRGTIRHPSSGGNYQNNENCVWIIKAGISPFEIKFIRFNTENEYDYLYVRNAEDIIKGNFTGSSVPTPLLIFTDTASLRFTSDSIDTRTGFEIEWNPIFKIPL